MSETITRSLSHGTHPRQWDATVTKIVREKLTESNQRDNLTDGENHSMGQHSKVINDLMTR